LQTDINNNSPEQIGFDLTMSSSASVNPTATLGQYFYQDFALAYSLGVTTTVSDWTTPTVEQVKTMATNHFTLNLAGLSNADTQAVKVKYVDRPTLGDLYLFNQGKDKAYGTDYMANQNFLKGKMLSSGYLNSHYQAVTDGFKSTAITMTAHPSWLSSIADGSHRPVGRTAGRWNIIINAVFGGLNSAGQPEIFSTQNFNIINSGYGTTGVAGSPEFAKEVADATTKYFANAGTGSTTTINPYASTTYYAFKPQAIALYKPYPTKNPDPTDISKGAVHINDVLGPYLTNPKPQDEDKDNGQPNSNPILDGNKTWPAGTTFEWINSKGVADNILLDKAGVTYTGSIKITLPSGTSTTVDNIQVSTIANVIVKNETVDYGTKLDAKDLVENIDRFPEGTTFEYVSDATTPNWAKSGSYNNVQIKATYPKMNGDTGEPILDDNGKQEYTTSVPGKGAVAINDVRQITVMKVLLRRITVLF
jgi:Rib/alpha/Esp surface antigen-like repeat protein